jgi:hypothetical protein
MFFAATMHGDLSKLYAQDADSSLTWTLLPAKNDVFPGEPVLLVVEIGNQGKEEVGLDFGWDGLGAFSFKVQSITDEIVRQGPSLTPEGGIATIDRIVIPSGATREKRLVLNRWCSTNLPVGDYRVTCRVEPRMMPPAEATCTIRITNADEEHVRQVFAALAQNAFNPIRSPETMHSLEMLAFTNSPSAVNYQVRIVRDYSTFNRLGERTMETLIANRTPESLQALISVCENDSFTSRMRRIAIKGIYDLRETVGTPEILLATEGIVTRHPKPILEKILD